MKRIERSMVKAVKDGRNRTLDNTTVTVNDDKVDVTLYNTSIAIVDFSRREVALNAGHWHTMTTKSRLNALLNGLGATGYIFQKDGDWFYQDGQGPEPFENGMTVGF